jgi:hypothetical protein
VTQYHLFGDGYCGRAVRLRELTAAEVEENANVAASLLNENDKMMKLQQVEFREGCKLMLVAVSKEEGLTPEKVAKLRQGDWEPLNLMKVKMPDSPWCYETLFWRAKDHAALVRLFRKFHVPRETELDAIVEKGCPVATEDAVRSIGPATGTGG